MAIAADQVSYDDLYARWEAGNWPAAGIDLSVDRDQWLNTFTELERRAALWTYW
jgi:ribonucleotide reductase beta subunit family protein with ferritin-like domain